MRELILSNWYRETFEIDWAIKDDQDAIGNFGNTRGGVRQSKGLNAKITGDRADALIADDPNDLADAFSDVKLEGVNTRWDSATRNRVNDYKRSFRVIIQQRVHENDLTGHLLRKGGYDHLCIPMEFGEDKCRCPSCKPVKTTFLGWKDPRTKPKESIHPERFPPEVIAEEKRGLGPLQAPGLSDRDWETSS